MTEKACVFDIVCGQLVDCERIEHRTSYETKTYYFCCERCLAAFLANPGRYLEARHVYGPFH